ncbi:MAG: hypothetical protein GQ570_03340 [Helicobacteraceae bacterium]|nr:hypothetical protein [Helicobacteraceae bacterium]
MTLELKNKIHITEQDKEYINKLHFKEMRKNVNQALELHYEEVVKIIPMSALIIDSDSKICFSNNIFKNTFFDLEHTVITLDSLFIEKEGYLSNNSIIDWKDIAEIFQEIDKQKVLINLFDLESEFYIHIKKLDFNGYYLVILSDTYSKDVLF